MKKTSSTSTLKSQNQVVNLRRSTRLTDKFKSLPHEITSKIFSKMEDDPKTLIRCSAVCKNWTNFVFETTHLSLTFSSRVEEGRPHALPCSKRHNHIPVSSIPFIMKAFPNLDSVEIKLCRCPSLTPYPPCFQNMTKMNVLWTGDHSQADTCMAFEVGKLSTIEGTNLSPDLSEERKFATILGSSVMDFFWRMLDNRPKTLRSLVIRSAQVEGVRSGGKVFIKYDQLSKLCDSVLNLRVNERWLEEPENVVFWHKNKTDNKNLLHEQVWIVYQWQFLLANRQFTIKELHLKETDLKDLVAGLDVGN